MAAILSAVDVVDGVLDAVSEDGAVPPTARRLAARLHVAPATLYSAIPAMGCAYRDARTRTVENALGAIVDAFARGQSARLVEMILDRPNEALFMTDPGVVLGVNPMVERALSRVGIGHVALTDLLALAGSLFSRRDLPAADELEARTDRLVSWYRDNHVGDQRPTLPETDGAAILALAQDVEHVDPGQKSRTGADAENARRASAEIVIRPRAETGSDWSFRELSRITDIPVTRLHRYGSRTDHLARAAADLLRASRRLTDADGTGLGPIAAAVQTGLGDVLIELYRSSRAVESGADAIAFGEVLSGVLSPSAVAVMSSRQTNGDEPATVAGVTCLVSGALVA